MKVLPKFFTVLLMLFVLLGATAQAQDKPKGWSRKAKGAAIGGGSGAVVGGLLGGGKGAVLGAAAGVVGGGLIGRKQDKKKDPARYQGYRNK